MKKYYVDKIEILYQTPDGYYKPKKSSCPFLEYSTLRDSICGVNRKTVCHYGVTNAEVPKTCPLFHGTVEVALSKPREEANFG